LIPQLLPGQQKTLISSVLGFGKTIITVTVDDTQTTANGFVLLIFVIGVQ
jgi:Flp pilus assembly protein CpaB